MAQGTLAFFPLLQAFDNNGDPVSGAKAYWYLAGTSTPVNVYTTVGLTTPHAVPVVADAYGRFAEIYLTPGVSYKLDLKTSGGVSLTGYPADNISAVPVSGQDVDVTATAGENITTGQAVYLSDGSGSLTAGSWYRADADALYSSVSPQIGMAPDAIAIGTTGTVRIAGRITDLSSLVVGSTYYVSATAGAITATAPSNRRVMGVADTATSLILATNPATATGDDATTILGVQVFS